jgi:hypothetical protein
MPQPPHADKGKVCPLHKRDMSLVCHKCPLWVQIHGKHPQGEEIIDHWNCSLAFLPMLLIENSQMQRQTGAAVESFRNCWVGEQAKTFNRLTQVLAASAQALHGERLPKLIQQENNNND